MGSVTVETESEEERRRERGEEEERIIRWPKSVKEACCGLGLGDPDGQPRTFREAVCGTSSQVLLFQLWFSAIFSVISVLLLVHSPYSPDALHYPTIVDIIYFTILTIIEIWTIFITIMKRHKTSIFILVIWIGITAGDTYYLIFPIVTQRFLLGQHFVSYTVNQSLDVLNDLFIVGLFFVYLREYLQKRGERKRLLDEREKIVDRVEEGRIGERGGDESTPAPPTPNPPRALSSSSSSISNYSSITPPPRSLSSSSSSIPNYSAITPLPPPPIIMDTSQQPLLSIN